MKHVISPDHISQLNPRDIDNTSLRTAALCVGREAILMIYSRHATSKHGHPEVTQYNLFCPITNVCQPNDFTFKPSLYYSGVGARTSPSPLIPPIMLSYSTKYVFCVLCHCSGLHCWGSN